MLTMLQMSGVCIKWKLFPMNGIRILIWLEHAPPRRIDYYWNQVSQLCNATGSAKIPTLMKVVKSVLVIAHENADVERGLSDSGKN